MKVDGWNIVFTEKDLPTIDGDYIVQSPGKFLSVQAVRNGKFRNVVHAVAWREMPKPLTEVLPDGVLVS